jgi:hypothetical protein
MRVNAAQRRRAFHPHVHRNRARVADPVTRGRSKIVIRSPLSGFSMTWFGEVIVVTSRPQPASPATA